MARVAAYGGGRPEPVAGEALAGDGRYLQDIAFARHLDVDSEAVARLAAGATVAAVDHGWTAARRGLRGGHHAERARALLPLQQRRRRRRACAWRGERIAVVDYDVHHGNGIFYDDPRAVRLDPPVSVLPGHRGADDVGRGDGAGTTVNVPAGSRVPGGGDAEERRARLMAKSTEGRGVTLLISSPRLSSIIAWTDAARRTPRSGPARRRRGDGAPWRRAGRRQCFGGRSADLRRHADRSP